MVEVFIYLKFFQLMDELEEESGEMSQIITEQLIKNVKQPTIAELAPSNTVPSAT